MTIWDPGIMQSNAGTPSYTAQELRFYLRGEDWDEGVLRPSALKVGQRGAGANMTVDVAAGDAIVTGDDQANQGRYAVRVDATVNVTGFTAPAGSNQRYDLVVLRINDPDAGGTAGRTATLERVAGTAAVSPTVPATPTSCLLLAVVGPFTSSTTSVTTGMVHDAQTATGPSGATAAHLLAGERSHAGKIVVFAGSSGWVPNGWLLCYGQAISRSTYVDLFTMLGTTYGSGDGSTTFNVPDFRGRVPVGLDNMGGSDAGRLSASNTLGGTGGAETVTLIEANLPVHAHSMDHDHPTASPTVGGTPLKLTPLSVAAGTDGNTVSGTGSAIEVDLPNYTGNTGNAGSATPFSNLQPYALINVIIRT